MLGRPPRPEALHVSSVRLALDLKGSGARTGTRHPVPAPSGNRPLAQIGQFEPADIRAAVIRLAGEGATASYFDSVAWATDNNRIVCASLMGFNRLCDLGGDPLAAKGVSIAFEPRCKADGVTSDRACGEPTTYSPQRMRRIFDNSPATDLVGFYDRERARSGLAVVARKPDTLTDIYSP